MNRYVRFLAISTLILLVAVGLSATVFAENQVLSDQPIGDDETDNTFTAVQYYDDLEDWRTFTHPELGFSFLYPANWSLENNLSFAYPSGTVSIRNQMPNEFDFADVNKKKVQNIEIGLHLVESQKDVSPLDWLNAYSKAGEQNTGLFDEEIYTIEELAVDGYPSVYKAARSPSPFMKW